MGLMMLGTTMIIMIFIILLMKRSRYCEGGCGEVMNGCFKDDGKTMCDTCRFMKENRLGLIA